jgi:hypothetical protein
MLVAGAGGGMQAKVHSMPGLMSALQADNVSDIVLAGEFVHAV